MPNFRVLPALAAALLVLSACKGATEVCDPSDPLCNPGGSNPSISISDVTVGEGDGGTVSAVFNVTLSESSTSTVTVAYATADASAASPDDYEDTFGTLTFPGGTTTMPITVQVISDIIGEANETFTVALSTPTNATIADPSGTGTITDDDACSPTGTIVPGQRVSEMLETTDCTWTASTDYFDMWTITLADTSYLAIDMTSNVQDFDPYLAVFELDGVNNVQDDDGGFDLNSRHALIFVPGTFVIYAAAATSGGEVGNYDLSVTEIPVGVEYYGSTSGGFGANAAELYQIDPETGAPTLMGPIGFNRVGAMAFHPTTDVLYGVGDRTSDGVEVLITIDPATGAGAEVGPTGLFGVAGLAFRDDGTLFLYSSGHSLYTVDLATGTANLVGVTGNPGNGGNGIAFNLGGVLYHSNRDESHTLDTTTGAAAFVADMDFPMPCEDAAVFNDGRVSGVDRPGGYAEFYGVVKCNSGSTDPSTYLGQVDFDTGYVIIIGQAQDNLDGFAILTN